MSDETAHPDPTTEQPGTTPETTETTEPPARTRTRLRDRVLGIRGIAAVGLAGLVLGGLGGAAIGIAVDDDGHDGRPARFGSQFPGEDGHRGPEGGVMPPGGPGQAPPSTAPDEETQPDGSTDNSGSSNS